MATPKTDPKLIKEARDALAKYGSAQAAASALGLPRTTLRNRLKLVPTAEDKAEIHYPEELDDDIDVGEIIQIQARRFAKRKAAHEAKKHQTITLNHSDPIVVAFVGDPHLDDDGCDWPRLLDHIELFKRPRVYGVNVGDTTNNWCGRLARLFANQETSQKTARKLAKWFLAESGVKWLAWVLGNHDAWGDGSDILRLMNTTGVTMDDWAARFRVRFANGCEVPMWVAHDFPGHSQWNNLHGPMKAALMRGGAGVYACGHKHSAAMHWEPLQDHDAAFWAMRSRGYKVIDHYAEQLGYGSQNDGHTTAVVINPMASGADLIHGFKDLRSAVIFRDALAASC